MTLLVRQIYKAPAQHVVERKGEAQHVSERQVTYLYKALNVVGDFRYDLILSLDHNCVPAVSRLRVDRTESA